MYGLVAGADSVLAASPQPRPAPAGRPRNQTCRPKPRAGARRWPDWCCHWAVCSAPGGSLFFPQRASAEAAVVDEIFYFILIVSVIFFALIVGLMLVFLWKYRRREGEGPQASPSHSTSLEMLWTIIPTILVAVMFVWGFRGYMEMRQAPDDSYEVQVLAKKWAWSFVYPNGHIEPDLHVPVDRPIRLVMTSDNVIHSLYIPAFRLKMDVVPGRYTKTWFQATSPASISCSARNTAALSIPRCSPRSLCISPASLKNGWRTRQIS